MVKYTLILVQKIKVKLYAILQLLFSKMCIYIT